MAKALFRLNQTLLLGAASQSCFARTELSSRSERRSRSIRLRLPVQPVKAQVWGARRGQVIVENREGALWTAGRGDEAPSGRIALDSTAGRRERRASGGPPAGGPAAATT